MKISHNRRTIIAILIALFALLVAIYLVIRHGDICVQNIDMTEYEVTSAECEMNFCVDEVTNDSIKGWIYEAGHDAKNIAIHVVLVDVVSGNAYMLPTTIQERSDVQEAYGDANNYELSGFWCVIRDSKIDLVNNNYHIYILYQYDETEKLVDLDSMTFDWR